MLKNFSVLLLLTLVVLHVRAFPDNLQLDNVTYDPSIRTVQFYVEGSELSFPILSLRNPAALILEFDELVSMDVDPEDFYVSFVSCDANWEPSDLLPLEYLEGFTYDRILDWRRSENTRIPYLHYWYVLDPEVTKFKKSGNYVMYVYRNSDESDLVLSRRFIISDNQIGIRPSQGLTFGMNRRSRIQTLNFDLYPSGLDIQDPYQDLKVVILQNFRWDNAATEVQPRFITGEKLEYSFDAAMEFEGGNEYRLVDLRSTRFHSQKMENVHDFDSLYYVSLYPDQPRLKNKYLSQMDFNGSYFIEVQEWPDGDWQADYLLTHFRLDINEPIRDGEIYLFGAMTDWQAKDEFRLLFDAKVRRYETTVLLKQGFYDYQYIIKDDRGRMDETRLEGSHFETENFYTILVYHKGITDRNHRLLGIAHVNYQDF